MMFQHHMGIFGVEAVQLRCSVLYGKFGGISITLVQSLYRRRKDLESFLPFSDESVLVFADGLH